MKREERKKGGRKRKISETGKKPQARDLNGKLSDREACEVRNDLLHGKRDRRPKV